MALTALSFHSKNLPMRPSWAFAFLTVQRACNKSQEKSIASWQCLGTFAIFTCSLLDFSSPLTPSQCFKTRNATDIFITMTRSNLSYISLWKGKRHLLKTAVWASPLLADVTQPQQSHQHLTKGSWHLVCLHIFPRLLLPTPTSKPLLAQATICDSCSSKISNMSDLRFELF